MKKWMMLPLVLLAACTGVDGEKYIGAPGSPAWFATASPNTVAAYFSQNCTAYGFKPGTPEMAQCIQMEASNRKQTNAVRSAATANAIAMNNAAMQANRPRQTHCTGFGNTVNCTTY